MLYLSFSCTPATSQGYALSAAAAQRAYAAGDYEEAAHHWHEAAQHAERARNRDEASFRAAASHERASQHERALRAYAELVRRSPHGERTPRALYQIAKLELAKHGPAQYQARLLELIRTYPSSGLANPALTSYVKHLERTRGDEVVLSRLETLSSELLFKTPSRKLDEHLSYTLALTLVRLGAKERALAQLLWTAETFHYPEGAYFDDCLWRAAKLELELNRPRRALAHLNKLLEVREKSPAYGSYDRGRYDDAQYLVAEIYRDELADSVRARHAFHALFSRFRSSRLRDDALWQKAILARQARDKKDACAAIGLLLRECPDSRYGGCAGRLCSELTPDQLRLVRSRPCHRYIVEELERKLQQR